MTSAIIFKRTVLVLICITMSGCAPRVDEQVLTETALGVEVEEFPTGQKPGEFSELPQEAPTAEFQVHEQSVSGPRPQYSFERRPIVRAKAPDGTEYEAYCGYSDSSEIEISDEIDSNTGRQTYGTHHGATYHAESVFIGTRKGGRLRSLLILPDVGSHTTAPHALAVDSQGKCHLAVADVNIFQDNRLELYWVIGDPRTRMWTKAWLVEQKGFTSWAHPRSVAWGDSVHLLWDWADASHPEAKGQCGLFHVEWNSSSFSSKVRVAVGEVRAWDMAADPESGLILVVCSTDDGVLGATRQNGVWSRPARILNEPVSSLTVEARPRGFVLRTGVENTREWAIAVVPASL